MKLVEIINGYSTSEETTGKIVALSGQLGKTPCVVRDYPGFISNRILMPMNPAYNPDRGPVSLLAARVHISF